MQNARREPSDQRAGDTQRQLVDRFAETAQRNEKTRGDRRPDPGPVEQAVGDVDGHHCDGRFQRKSHVIRIALSIRQEQARYRPRTRRVRGRSPASDVVAKTTQRIVDRHHDRQDIVGQPVE